MSDLATGTSAVVTLVALALVVASVAERMRVPPGVAMVTVGLAATLVVPIHLPVNFGDALLVVFLPPLIFEAAWSLQLRQLFKMLPGIAVLALPGVLLTAGVIALLVGTLTSLTVPEAFLFGAIVPATDPVAVTAIFRRLPVPIELVTLIEGESLANDGVAIVLYTVAVAAAAGDATPSLWGSTLAVVLAIAGGIAIGFAAAVVIAVTMRRTADAATQGTSTLVLGYIAYLAADHLHCSGVFATATAAITLRSVAVAAGAQCDAKRIEDFWSVIGFVANSLVFLATGLSLRLRHVSGELHLLGYALLGVIATRLVLAYVVLPLLHYPLADWRWKVTTYLAGMRGGVSLALALAIPGTVADRGIIIDTVFATVMLTLVVQGLPLERILTRIFAATAPSP